jgi:FixJ family two-component response regulator
MSEPPSIVFVVDDDSSIRDALKSLIRSVGLKVELFRSPREFLQAKRPDAPSCLILDVRLPGESGLDLQRELADSDHLYHGPRRYPDVGKGHESGSRRIPH